MGISTLLFGQKKKKSVGGITFDVLRSESFEFSSSSSSFPTELGFSISDHSQNDPITVEIECLISNYHPLGIFDDNPSIFSVSQNLSSGQSRANAAYEELKRLHREKELVTYVGDLDTYENMFIENISIPRTPDTGDAIEFSMTLKEIRTVTSLSVIFGKGIVGGPVSTKRQVQSTVNL